MGYLPNWSFLQKNRATGQDDRNYPFLESHLGMWSLQRGITCGVAPVNDFVTVGSSLGVDGWRSVSTKSYGNDDTA
jgi:hypothetical protein